MIPISQITAELAALLQRRTGVFAIDERLSTAVYPSYYVAAQPKNTVLIAGGRQLLRRVTVSITCYPSRKREEEQGRDLTDLLYGVLLPAIPLAGRSLAPEAIETEEADNIRTLQFTLEFCDLPAAPQDPPCVPMEQLHFSLGQETGQS